MLYRIGNKQRQAKEILKWFPEHDTYIEPFFGGGGLFFKKQKAKINIVNDLDSEVFNLFTVIKSQKDEFYNAFCELPIDQNIFNYWKKNQEIDAVQKALRFVLLSNFSYLGQSNTFSIIPRDIKKLSLSRIMTINKLLNHVLISCLDFEVFLQSIHFDDESEKSKAFIYADPPYIGTSNNYQNRWKDKDTYRLFDVLKKTNIRFAISETNNEQIYDLSEHYGLNIIEIGNVKRLKSIRKEVLITNY